MAKKKKTGRVPMGVRPSRFRPAGRTSTTVDSGIKRAEPRSTTATRIIQERPMIGEATGLLSVGKFASRAEQRRAEALISDPERRTELLSRNSPTLSEAKKMTGSPSSRANFPRAMVKSLSMRDGDFHLWGPFWSQALGAYRVEYYEHDSRQVGQTFQSSFLCSKEEDAKRLAAAARKITNRAGWIALRDEALVIAGESDGVIYRVMMQERETFTKHGG